MRALLTLVLLAASIVQAPRPDADRDAVAFAVIGDSGTGDRVQFELGRQMAAAHDRVPYGFVIMLGDNIYGRHDFAQKFELPYKPLLDVGVRFYASLGNHDDQANRFYRGFNMNGQRYYSFAAKNVRFFALDSDYLDPSQLEWIQLALASSREQWKICFFHHPLYSDGGRHGSQIELRTVLEPLFVKHDVQVVFSGHDHIYERLKPQRGIQYFVAGAGGQLRKGDIRRSAMTAAAFDEDQSFMLVEVAGDELTFQAISRTGTIVDAGTIRREVRP